MGNWGARLGDVIKIFTALALDRWLGDLLPELTKGPYAPVVNDAASLVLSVVLTVAAAEVLFARPEITTDWVKRGDRAPYTGPTAHVSYSKLDSPVGWEMLVNYSARSVMARAVTELLGRHSPTLVVSFEPDSAIRCARERQSAKGVAIKSSSIRFPLGRDLKGGTVSWGTITMMPRQTPGAITVRCRYALISGEKRLRILRALIHVSSNVRELRLVRSD